MLEGSNSNFEAAEHRIYADDECLSLSLLKRLEKKLDDMTMVFQQMVPKLAEFESKILKLELAVNELSTSMKSNTEHDGHQNKSKQRFLNLQFSDKICSPVRTGEEIKGVEGNYLRVTLVNETGELVDSGPESSAEVHIFALKESDDDENEGDSVEKKLKKETVLVGDVQLKLTKGIGILANIKFKSSSRHVSGLFKIGARVVLDSFHSPAIVVQDAKTPPFRVRDYRGKYNEKHRPPCLCDEVWRLDNIGKGGSIHNRLKNLSFDTVEDFLIQLLKDSDGLKQLVDLPQKKWEATVKHALTCQLDDKIYCSIHSEENTRIVFNAIGKVLGLIIQNKYFPLDTLSHEHKVYASTVDVATYVHKNGLFPFPNEASVVQHFVGVAEPFQHPSQLTTMSGNTMDYCHEDEEESQNCREASVVQHFVGGVAEPVQHPSQLTTMSGNTMDYYHEDEEESQNCRSLSPIDNYMGEFNMEEPFDIESLLFADGNQNTSTSFSDMLLKSPAVVVSDKEVKKKLFLFFTIAKWFLNYERITASSSSTGCSESSDRDANGKRRRFS